ncbi:hypothetical protein V6x_47040 [Gimesia chilikensis]|uniref:Uncharacterized protein n=1 Tax=Gimesia chilikensis TaxID=2605989 RepID=A0A517WI93_9PLAN|nr:hypothetical protein V6x_47040 [Gimesia chilikensis]
MVYTGSLWPVLCSGQKVGQYIAFSNSGKQEFLP